MTVFIENENSAEFKFDYEKVIRDVIEEAVAYVDCPFEVNVEVTITDNERIRAINRDQRDMDKATDVLSFPLIDYETPGDFSFLEDTENDFAYDYFEPDTGELMLGDIVVSSEKVYAQAEEYCHSCKRELGFLIAHSMLHLFGYDHMEEDERVEMERMQGEILDRLGITRHIAD
ncbi:MAG: rRNA maturation RNase YbeY [Lachnospiraceae bacterium]|nr:rRNA maturation RNase YbeY [Lachnospiraceae bacterium]